MLQNETNDLIKETLAEHVLTLHFVGTEDELDKLATNALGSNAISARGFVIHQWLSVLQQVSVRCKDDPSVPPLESLK